MALVMAAGASAHTLASNKQAARRDVTMLLDRLRLPTSAVRVKKEALSWPRTDEVEADAHWRVPRSVAEVVAFIKRHPPHRGRTPRVHTIVENGEFVQQAVIQWPMIRGVLYNRFLDIALKAERGGTTAVQASASDYWFVPRSAVVSALAGAGVLTVTRGSSRIVATKNTRQVQRIAAMFEHLQIIQPGVVISCYAPNQASAWITFKFYARPQGPELARATVPPAGSSPCGPAAAFAVPGQEQAFLLTSPSFLRTAGSVLGVRLAS